MQIPNKLAYIILIVICSLTYYNVINGEFIYDDVILIKDNTLVKSIKNIPDFFIINPVNTGGITISNFYRPTQHIINSSIHHIFGLNVIPYHIVSILLHLFNSILLFRILKDFRVSTIIAIFGSLLFVVHPINLEAVSYISGVADPLSLFIILLSVRYLYNNKDSLVLQIVKTTGLFILALLSKESAVIIPFLY